MINEVLRYEEMIQSQLAQLPLPDPDFAWLEMKKLLEEEEDDAVIVPPPVRKGCAGIALLILAALVAGWFLVKPAKWFRSGKVEDSGTVQQQSTVSKAADVNPDSPADLLPENENNTTTNLQPGDSLRMQNDTTMVRPGNKETGNRNPGQQPVATEAAPVNKTATPALQRTPANNTDVQQPALHKKQVQSGAFFVQTKTPGHNKKKVNHYRPQSPKENGMSTVMKDQQSAIETTKTTAAGKEHPSAVVPSAPAGSDSLPVMLKTDPALLVTIVKNDSSAKSQTIRKEDPEQPAAGQPKTPKKKMFWFAAGLGITQQLPLNGQKTTPYNYYGRTSSLADYLPSVYARLHRDDKWFLQGEFRYGAPQYTKEFTYARVVRTDSNGQVTGSRSYSVKKTFYHQLPLSFHYRLLPGFTAGAGLIYNQFYGAVSNEQVLGRIPGTIRDSLISEKIISVTPKTDTSFEKSNLQGLFELQYQWKRFTLGARYSFGLQPYIRFNDPVTGLPREEKNQNLNLFLKVELWNSKKKK